MDWRVALGILIVLLIGIIAVEAAYGFVWPEEKEPEETGDACSVGTLEDDGTVEETCELPADGAGV